ncbi:hypothetical protein OPV22_004729 [Ensete ventricosum]|uniref:Uncharacterized protein n=1 Tax=Ensete ventricosum TaxID=4639 RepID=A0AAV8RL80_ENSVE|nr:hypothetical protein OPV22_004729 [Ensete ventricosum]
MHKTMQDESDRQHRAEKSCPPNEVEKPSRFRHHQGNESFQLREGRITSHSTSTNSNPYFSNVPSRDDERCTVLPPHKRVELSRRTYRHRKFQDSIDPSGRQGEEGVSKMSIGEQVHVDGSVSSIDDVNVSESTTTNVNACDGSVSSIDDGCSVLPPHKRLELSHRTFHHAPHKRIELSRRTFQQRNSQDSVDMFIPNANELSTIDTSQPVRDSFIDFEDYHSMQNWSDSKNEESVMSPSSDVEFLKSSTNDQTEMSKVNELREEIDEKYDKSDDEREGRFHLREEKLTPQLDLNCTRFPSIKARRRPMRDNSSVDFEDSKNEELVMSLSSDAEFLSSSTNDQMEMSKVNELREEIDEKYDKSKKLHSIPLREEKLTPQLDLNCTRLPSLKASKEG